MTEKNNYSKEIYHLCSSFYDLSNLAIQYIDNEGKILVQMIQPHFPDEILSSTNDSFQEVEKQLRQQKPDCCYFFITSFQLEYIAIGLWKEKEFKGSILVGPFLSTTPNLEFINYITSMNHLPLYTRKTLANFYESLVIVHSQELHHLNVLLINLFSHPYIMPDLRSSEPVQPTSTRREVRYRQQNAQQLIEARYQFENTLMEAISKGDSTLAVTTMNDHQELTDFSSRNTADPVRAYKNILVTLNTLSRKAAEKGGVHPIYLDSISEKFALMIERTKDLPSLSEISRVLLTEYSESIWLYSNPEYSTIVKKAIHYILLHIDYPLTLEEIARNIYVNPAHLSRKFKGETQMTPTQFIHLKKVEEAKLHLEKGHLAITEIALLVGFNDPNYFGKVFKKVTGMTPSQFIRSTKKALKR